MDDARLKMTRGKMIGSFFDPWGARDGASCGRAARADHESEKAVQKRSRHASGEGVP